MTSFVKSLKFRKDNRDHLIKHSITTQLSNAVKEIQLYNMNETVPTSSVQRNEAESALCITIEAMFLHGLKDSLVHKARRAISDVDEQPNPSFWASLLIVSHRQIIEQITSLTQITTEVGQCRAWIRLTLNDYLLSSYLSTIAQDSSGLKSYYNPHAYLRDGELLEIAQRLIEGVEAVANFSLPCNSSLLNTWQLQSLVLAGIWSPTLRSCPVSAGIDVAQSLQSTSAVNSETVSLNSAISYNSHSSGIGPTLSINEDEALKIILGKYSATHSYNSSPTPFVETNKNETLGQNNEKNINRKSNDIVQNTSDSNLGNSITCKSGWSFSENEGQFMSDKEIVEPISTESTSHVQGINKSMESSYNALIESYNLLGGAYVKTPDLKEVWQHLENKKGNEVITEKLSNLPSSEMDRSCVGSESSSLSIYIGKIATEKGLDYQNYECAGCNQSLGVTPKPKVCIFSGEYFCESCMSTDTVSLSAHIIHNWDFKSYPVSQKAWNYLNKVQDQPNVDLKVLNPYIYTVSEEMTKLQTLRIQLNFLRDYLYTCREPVIEELQKQMHGKEYMYEHIHYYSIKDLFQIRNGALLKQLEKVINYGIEHVKNCWLCSQKGFICEICNKSKVLYPFDVDSVYRCNVCNAVYHNGCLNSIKPCPKCERKKKREDLPLLGATME